MSIGLFKLSLDPESSTLTQSKTFYELSQQLALAGDELVKSELQREFSLFLAQDTEFSEALLRNVLLHSLEASSAGRRVVDSEFYSLRQRVYRDLDGLYKVALGVAFLQAPDNHDPDLEERLMKDILVSLELLGLQAVVNDISVNGLQLRNGSSDSLL